MPGRRFCPKCGKPYEGEGLCAACYLEQRRLFEVPEFIEVKICPRCGAAFKTGKWMRISAGEAVEDAVRAELRMNSEAKNPEIEIAPEKIDGYSWRADVNVSATLKGKRVSEKANVTLRVRREACERCSKIAAGYYNAIVQIRGDKRLPTMEELLLARKIAYDAIQKLKQSGDELAFISDEKEVSEGLDLYVGNLGAGKQISKAIAREIGGSISQSPKLMGKKEGKEIYRVTYSIRLPEFVNGDIVAIDGEVIEVKRLDKLLTGIDLKTGARYSKLREQLKSIVKIGSRSDRKKTVLTMAGDSEIQILDPEDYSPVYLSRPKFLKEDSGGEIFVVKTAKGIFVLPD